MNFLIRPASGLPDRMSSILNAAKCAAYEAAQQLDQSALWTSVLPTRSVDVACKHTR